jgi:glutathione-regulated potassium-efflux system protein KefB
MADTQHSVELLPVISLLAAAVIAGPIFKRLGFGSVLGYLVAGIAVGPFGLHVLTDPTTILNVAELGVVLFLFIIGLEMRPMRLWGLRKQIFGLGLVQVVCCTVLLTAISVATGSELTPAFIAGAGFVLTSTAIVMQILEDRREVAAPGGQRIVSILLLEDLCIVPLLAIVGVLSQLSAGGASGVIDWLAIGAGAAAIAGVTVAGRYLLNPLFQVLANTRSSDVMTAAALLVVLGAAYAMQLGGLSMAMGAFLAGVLLAESSFRNQLEVDVEPFRAMLLGLFFLAVGMSLDLAVVLAKWTSILLLVAAYMLVKSVGIYVIARLFGSDRREALDRAILMAQGGEFAFVLYGAAAAGGLIDAQQSSEMTAAVIISMMLTPIVISVAAQLRRAAGSKPAQRERPDNLTASVLIIGFGRVGQIASQLLLSRGHSVSIIDIDVEMIDIAREFEFRVYYGDGARLDVLQAAGAARARAVLVCVDGAQTATRIVELVKSEFKGVAMLARSVDRRHSLDLIRAGADFHVRETFESAMLLGSRALQALGATDEEIATIAARIRDRDNERLQRELLGGRGAGKAFFSGRLPEGQEVQDGAAH